ncbi:nitrile hydratase accessory protein [Mesorhizobium ventifaucium]|uniref:NHase_beta domain-containing protein n=1 Tax=Mesorhizobium ventifaucium TaxID=666020 RepID=A0ABM9E3H8_9HYPH|nr:nitrile hydratase accessory protein [Mesorhizobium ventifaucium]CAH2403285.1 NHase_beta domain-containing protein [Mesorhizobium ventifaucium]
MSRREAKSVTATLPTGVEAPIFAEPWQAEAFAMTVALHDKGLFSWSEWAGALSAEVKQPGAASDGHDYYEHWLAALENLLSAKGVAGKGDIDALAAAWGRAALATPHGKPILLENDPSPTEGRGGPTG